MNELIDRLDLSKMYGTVESFLGWDDPAVDDGLGSIDPTIEPTCEDMTFAQKYLDWCSSADVYVDEHVLASLVTADALMSD